MLFQIELIGKVDIGFAVEEVAKIQAGPFQVHGVDLKITPIERAVSVVVIDFAPTLRVFGALDGKRNAAIGAKLLARVLLVGGERAALVLLRPIGVFGASSQADYDGRLEMEAQGPLQAERISRMNGDDQADESRADQKR